MAFCFIILNFDNKNHIEKEVRFDYLSDMDTYITYAYDNNGCRIGASYESEQNGYKTVDEYLYQYQKMTLNKVTAEKLQALHGDVIVVIAE